MDGSLARRIYAFAVICTFCLSFFSAPSQADITVADNLKNSVGMSSYDIGIGTSNIINGPLVFTNESGGQRFVAGASGNLTTITSNVATWNPGNDSLNVSIYQASGNVPGTLLLYRGSYRPDGRTILRGHILGCGSIAHRRSVHRLPAADRNIEFRNHSDLRSRFSALPE